MVAERRYVDLEDKPDLAGIARELHDLGELVVLREAGRHLALLVPLRDSGAVDDSELDDNAISERHEALMELAGSMKGLVDEELLFEIYRSRTISSRPPIEV